MIPLNIENKNSFTSISIDKYLQEKKTLATWVNVIFDITNAKYGLSPINLSEKITIISSEKQSFLFTPIKSLFIDSCKLVRSNYKNEIGLLKQAYVKTMNKNLYNPLFDLKGEFQAIKNKYENSVRQINFQQIFSRTFLCVYVERNQKTKTFSFKNIQVAQIHMRYNAENNQGNISYSNLHPYRRELIKQQLKVIINKIPICFNEKFGLTGRCYSRALKDKNL